MTSYPINYEYDKRTGSFYTGFAETPDEARAIISDMLTEANGEKTDAPMPYLATTEAGITGSREQIESWWADEIADGWVTPVQVWRGWIAQVEYWNAD